MKKIFIALLLFTCVCQTQENKILERLRIIENGTKTWYDLDGYVITKETFKYDFNEQGLKKLFKKLDIQNESKSKLESIRLNNLFVSKIKKITEHLIQNESYYILENPNKLITVIWFAKFGTLDLEMEKELVNIIIEDKIPNGNYSSKNTEIIDFGGREIQLGGSCTWQNINSIQCPYYGQMNWSVHKTLESAQNSIDNQLAFTLTNKGGKIVSEEMVDVVFENVETKAKKVIYDFTGVKSMLAGMSGGKTLTIYYVAEQVRGNYMSCVMSFWNNDVINPETNFPLLLEEVMKLK